MNEKKDAGPKSIEEVAKARGGDAGNVDADSDRNKNEQSESHETEVEPVRSTGFAADGGDFDATKPGAAAEADSTFI